ncbi:Fc.00g046140.m01.CDS01 [Cosmosporella sp. VM-42]
MTIKTIAFLGASTGVGLSALKHTLAAGHKCIALCRTPSKLTDIMSPESNPNLQVVKGNAHDVASVSQCLKKEDGNLVDGIVSTIGGKPILSKLTIDDPNCCRKGMATLLEALAQLRRDGATGRPHIIVCSTTGMSRFGRDVPIATMPVYHIALKVPHEDKRIMEDSLAESGEDFTIVRCSFLVNGETKKEIRVGIEDPKTGRESAAIGYTISREDAGKWIGDNLLVKLDTKYLKKIATITY